MTVKEELENIASAIEDIRHNHLSHIEQDINEIRLDINSIDKRLAIVEEIKDLLKNNFSKMVTALITIAAAATGVNLMM